MINDRNLNQRVICLSGTSETQHDARPEGGFETGGIPDFFFTAFGNFWEILVV